jgi:hypothetical protein
MAVSVVEWLWQWLGGECGCVGNGLVIIFPRKTSILPIKLNNNPQPIKPYQNPNKNLNKPLINPNKPPQNPIKTPQKLLIKPPHSWVSVFQALQAMGLAITGVTGRFACYAECEGEDVYAQVRGWGGSGSGWVAVVPLDRGDQRGSNGGRINAWLWLWRLQ